METEYPYLLNKMQKFCAYQERCISEVKNKLTQLRVAPDVAVMIIEKLVKDNFINEERYARVFAGSKFRLNHWGRSKILYELKNKNLPEIYIQIGLNSIDDEEYYQALRMLLTKKVASVRESDPWKKKQKLAAYAIGKGFSSYLVWEVINHDLE